MEHLSENRTVRAILTNIVLAAISLFVNGFGIYLTMRAGIGAAPWDVFNLGLSKTFGILYGTASITVSVSILVIDILLREPIGFAMVIDAVVVGKSVDFFNRFVPVETPEHMPGRILLLFIGMAIIAYTQMFYMKASLGCGPRDTLLVGLKKRLKHVPIGAVSIGLLSMATAIGYLLGGPVGLGTVLCAFCQGPIMQWAFESLHFDATRIRHQNFAASLGVIGRRLRVHRS